MRPNSIGCLVPLLLGAGLLLGVQSHATVPDKFAYLIPQNEKRAVEWAKQQTQATRAKLEVSPNFTAVLADMRTVHANDRPLPTYHLAGGKRYFRIVRDRAHPDGHIDVADVQSNGGAGSWRTVFDLDAYNKKVGGSYSFKWINPDQECLPPDYDRCMLSLYYQGQNNAYIEIDVKSGTIVEDGFRITPGRNFVSWIDKDTLAVAHTTEGTSALPNQFPAELHVWRRGTPLAKARLIYRIKNGYSLFLFSVAGPPGDRHILVNVAKSYAAFQVKELTPDGQETDLPFPEGLANFGTTAFSQGKVVVQLDQPANVDGQSYPSDTIVAYDLHSHKISAIMTPPKDVYLRGGFAATRSGFTIVGVRNLQWLLYEATPSKGGWAVKQALVENSGLTARVESDGQSDTLLLREEGLLTPPRYRVLVADKEPLLLDSAKPEADLSRYTVDVRKARSRDGTMIDYYLMHRKDPRKGPTPTILQGYGGFGISDDPAYFCCRFGASWKTWFDRGGAFAIAAIRGGGERGNAWHLVATGHHKIRSFEDFDAVAEALEGSGFTDAKHLGITGHSEGGELTAVVTVMRPDLYGAAVIAAPTTDNAILGHGDGGISAGMASEEGDWDNPDDRRFMQVWDPYSNIRTGVRYPKTLLVVATTDNQVGPSHSRLFVAKMRSVGADSMLLEGDKGGHDFPDEFTQTADTAVQMSFFLDNLTGPVKP